MFEANFSRYYNAWLFLNSTLAPSDIREKWFDELKRIWKGVESSPQFYKSRAKHHFDNDNENKYQDGWVPLYVGKSRNVQARVWEHIEGMSSKTYGMKLMWRDTFIQDIDFRVSYSPLYELEDEVMYELVKIIENKVREKYQPIVGKK